MAKAIIGSTPAAPARGRPRTSTILAVLAFGFLAAVGVLGVDWTGDAAMVFGELVGIAAPIALVALAILLIHRLSKRSFES